MILMMGLDYHSSSLPYTQNSATPQILKAPVLLVIVGKFELSKSFQQVSSVAAGENINCQSVDPAVCRG